MKRSLYGLKHTPRCRYKKFDDFISKINNLCVYYKESSDGSLIYLLLYVDDMLLAGRKLTKLNEIKSQLNIEFEMKDLGS